MQPCWCNHLDATILMLKSHRSFPPSGLLPLILLPWHHLCRLSLLPSLLTLLLPMPSRCWQWYISQQVNQPWIHSWRLRHGNVGSIPGNIVGFTVTCANMLPTFPIKCYMLFQCRYCPAAIVAIATIAAIAAIFYFNAIFHQFTHLFCIAHIITDNKKNFMQQSMSSRPKNI